MALSTRNCRKPASRLPRQALRRNLGGDRLASRGEIQKLVLYAAGNNKVELDDVKAAIGDASGLTFDDAVDAILEGKIEEFDTIFMRQARAGNQSFLCLAAAMRQFQALQLMRAALDNGARSASEVVASARPPIFFSRRKIVEGALMRWNGEALTRALVRLQQAILQTRQRADLADSIARQALLGIAIESQRRKIAG